MNRKELIEILINMDAEEVLIEGNITPETVKSWGWREPKPEYKSKGFPNKMIISL